MRVFAAATIAVAAFALTTPQDALGVAAARRSSVARRLFLEDAKSGKSSFELACLVTREASAARSIGPRALETMDELSRMTSARLALQSLEPSRSSRAVRVARAVAATVLDRAEGFEVLRGHADREAHLVDACLATRRAGAPLALAVADEIARRTSGGAVRGALVKRGDAIVLLDDETGERAVLSLRGAGEGAAAAGGGAAVTDLGREATNGFAPRRLVALLLGGIQSSAAACGDLVELVGAADRILALAEVDGAVTFAEWQLAAVDVASSCCALDWTERRDEARDLLRAATREQRRKGEKPRCASCRAALLLKNPWFDEA